MARLAGAIHERRRPKLLAGSVRLAPLRREAVPAAPELPAPPGMSDFAARWIFGDGPVEGLPFAAAAMHAETGGERSRPSFLSPPPPETPPPAPERTERTAGPRPPIEEIGRYRLSARRPGSPPAPARVARSAAETPSPAEPAQSVSVPAAAAPDREPAPPAGPPDAGDEDARPAPVFATEPSSEPVSVPPAADEGRAESSPAEPTVEPPPATPPDEAAGIPEPEQPADIPSPRAGAEAGAPDAAAPGAPGRPAPLRLTRSSRAADRRREHAQPLARTVRRATEEPPAAAPLSSPRLPGEPPVEAPAEAEPRPSRGLGRQLSRVLSRPGRRDQPPPPSPEPAGSVPAAERGPAAPPAGPGDAGPPAALAPVLRPSGADADSPHLPAGNVALQRHPAVPGHPAVEPADVQFAVPGDGAAVATAPAAVATAPAAVTTAPAAAARSRMPRPGSAPRAVLPARPPVMLQTARRPRAVTRPDAPGPETASSFAAPSAAQPADAGWFEPGPAALQGSTGAGLAHAAGTTAIHEGGRSTVLFRAVGQPEAASAPAMDTPPAAGQAPAGQRELAAPPAPAAAAPAGGSADDEELYERVVDRLRRELMTERERMGDLLGDLP
ncbi:MAG: hypothetical protein ACTHNU_05180 [Gaiellales bacterium]